ncbi:endonuclease [Vibrio phage F99]
MKVSMKIIKGDVVKFKGTYLTLEDVKFIKNKSGKRKTHYIFSCPVCSKDSEMWPLGSIKCLPCEVKTGRPPCGCKSSVKYSERQNSLRVERKCQVLNYEFLGWIGDYSTIHKTGIKVFDKDLREYASFGSIVVFLSGKGKSQARQNLDLSKRDQVLNMEPEIEKFTSSGHYCKGTLFSPLASKLSGYWEIECPICSFDDYVNDGLCSGRFKIYKGDLDKGIKPCRCSSMYRWSQTQREYQVKKILEQIEGVWIGWADHYKNRSSKFKWVCQRGHESEKSVMTFLHGSGCKKCFDEDRCYGYYPHERCRKDNLYLIQRQSKGETLYKIGRSFNTLSRLSIFSKYYTCRLVAEFSDKHERIYMLEQCLHHLCKDHHYSPEVKFKGSVNECFTPEILNHPEIISMFNNKEQTNDQ